MVSRLKEARFKRQMTQWDLSLLSGISQSKISLIEIGYKKPTQEDKTRFAKALGVSMQDLFPADNSQSLLER